MLWRLPYLERGLVPLGQMPKPRREATAVAFAPPALSCGPQVARQFFVVLRRQLCLLALGRGGDEVGTERTDTEGLREETIR